MSEQKNLSSLDFGTIRSFVEGLEAELLASLYLENAETSLASPGTQLSSPYE